jgi:hypothetical protein
VTEQPEIWRTDPRERLLAAIDRVWARCELGATPEQLVDGYAHQLAEQIRQDTTVMGEAGDQYALCYAALIDPETQR